MSLLWADQLKVFLGMHAIEVRYQTGLTKKLRFSERLNIQNTAEENLAAAMQALKTLLQKKPLKKNTDLSIFLATDMARYLCLPAPTVAMSQDEKDAYVQAMFHKVYGQDAHWHVQTDHGIAKQNIVAYAVEKKMLEALSSLAAEFKVNLSAVSPCFAPIFNACAKKIQAENYVFFIIENNRLMTIHVVKQDLQKITVQKISHALQDAISPMQLIHRALTLSENQRNICIFNLSHEVIDTTALSDYQLMLPALALPKNQQFMLEFCK